MERGIKRWLVDISKWDPSPLDFSSALSILPQREHFSITSFVKVEDRKRALVSRLLQFAVVHQVLDIPFHDIVINRTLEGKPYLESNKAFLHFPNFNFNVSHHGDFVAIASEPLCIVGVDIVCQESNKAFLHFPNFNFNVSHHGDFVAIASEPLCIVGVDIVCQVESRNESIQEFLSCFTSYFSPFEWNNIKSSQISDEILAEFYRYWCLKEAFVKATGSGLTSEMSRIEFDHSNWDDISVKVDGKHMKKWRFWLFDLPKRHMICVARGPPKAAAESYKNTMNRMEFDEEEYNNALHLPSAKFVSQTVEQLISQCKNHTIEQLQ